MLPSVSLARRFFPAFDTSKRADLCIPTMESDHSLKVMVMSHKGSIHIPQVKMIVCFFMKMHGRCVDEWRKIRHAIGGIHGDQWLL
jgi:hypothetical protein